jgi:hypothetical protein
MGSFVDAPDEDRGPKPLSLRDGHSLESRSDPANSADDDFTTLMASSMVATFLNATSNPVSPGPSSPPLTQDKADSFVPPARPSSTPFPNSENHMPHVCCIGFSDYDSDSEVYDAASGLISDDSTNDFPPATDFKELPTEVHEAILDHLFGYRVSATSGSSMQVSSVTRSWGTALRHSRRRELTELALVSQTWRVLIQQRLYRHVKLKAAVDFLEDAMLHFARHEHLKSYVKHIEIWFPVFQPTQNLALSGSALMLPTVTSEGLTSTMYTLPRNNCTLEEVFRFVAHTLPQTRVLTLEGGERRKAPKVLHFYNQDPDPTVETPLPIIESVQTLVTKGQWNLMRDDRDFATVLRALPNLAEWQGSYSKPKSKSYITMSEFLPYLPGNITNLNLCLESDYRWEGVMPAFYYKVFQKTHICVRMAAALPALEHFAYTGRVCHQFFDMAMRSTDPRTSRLKSIDLTVKNCCRHLSNIHDSGSGIQDMSFIDAFEKLVLSSIRSLEKFQQLEYLRIRFMDLGMPMYNSSHFVFSDLKTLDSVLPPLNPYFLMRDGKCSGVWSDAIVNELPRVRPKASFVELNETFGDVVYNKEGRMVITPEYPRSRITSLKLANYRSLAARITIQ